MIMRGGKVVQIGRPEELVARPADAYVEDFVRDIPKSHVLTLKWVMRDPTPDDPVDGAVFPSTTVIRTVIHAAAASDKPIRVVDDGRLVGVVDRAHILEAIGGVDPGAGPSVAASDPVGLPFHERRERVEPIRKPTEATTQFLADAVAERSDGPEPG
jgi:hypothetical protein